MFRMSAGQEPKVDLPPEPEKFAAAVALSKLGASQGGKAHWKVEQTGPFRHRPRLIVENPNAVTSYAA